MEEGWRNMERWKDGGEEGILTELDAGKYGRATQLEHVDEALTPFVFLPRLPLLLLLPSHPLPSLSTHFQSMAHSYKTDFISC